MIVCFPVSSNSLIIAHSMRLNAAMTLWPRLLTGRRLNFGSVIVQDGPVVLTPHPLFGDPTLFVCD